MTTSPKFAAFIQGQIPEIAAFDKASTALSLDLDAFVNALRKFVTDHFVPVRPRVSPAQTDSWKGLVGFCLFRFYE